MDKLEYISRMLTKISHKRLESYVIYRIWNKLDMNDIKFDFQQYVRRKDGGYALADLYLPQLNISVEVNEPAHYYNQEKDDERRKEIRARGIRVLDIDCYNVDDGRAEECSLDELNTRIDSVVNELRKEINLRRENGNFLPWTIKDSVSAIKNHGILRVDDNISLNTVGDIAALFGKSITRRGWSCPGGIDISPDGFVKAWWPNTANKIWNNTISEDETVIEESHPDVKENKKHLNECLQTPNQERITFIKDVNWLGDRSYRFVGVYTLDVPESVSKNKCIWKRIRNEYEF